MTTPKLLMMRCCRGRGIPAELLDNFLRRNGATDADWAAVYDTGLAELKDGRFILSVAGEKAYKKESKGRYF